MTSWIHFSFLLHVVIHPSNLMLILAESTSAIGNRCRDCQRPDLCQHENCQSSFQSCFRGFLSLLSRTKIFESYDFQNCFFFCYLQTFLNFLCFQLQQRNQIYSYRGLLYLIYKFSAIFFSFLHNLKDLYQGLFSIFNGFRFTYFPWKLEKTCFFFKNYFCYIAHLLHLSLIWYQLS